MKRKIYCKDCRWVDDYQTPKCLCHELIQEHEIDTAYARTKSDYVDLEDANKKNNCKYYELKPKEVIEYKLIYEPTRAQIILLIGFGILLSIIVWICGVMPV